jgi:hypothetical protein
MSHREDSGLSLGVQALLAIVARLLSSARCAWGVCVLGVGPEPGVGLDGWVPALVETLTQ